LAADFDSGAGAGAGAGAACTDVLTEVLAWPASAPEFAADEAGIAELATRSK
jgi:hypothetical protein